VARELVHQIGRVTGDLPRVLTAPLYRSWHLRGTDAEVAAPTPGGDMLPGAQFRPIRAITIDTPPAAVWPWLAQVGFGRAGFYSNDLLDNFARPSLREIDSKLEQLEVGQWVSMSPTPSERTAWTVDSLCRTSGCCGATRQHLVVGAAQPRGRKNPAGHSCPCALRLLQPGIGRIGASPHGTRRLRDDAANAAGHQAACRKQVRSPVNTSGQRRGTIT
jgi:hypothetical protein